MAADARNAVRRLPEVQSVTVTLEDHYTADEINAAVSRGKGFTGAFPGETGDDDLHALRELFQRKALVARQSKICEQQLRAGASAEQVVALTVEDLTARGGAVPRAPRAAGDREPRRRSSHPMASRSRRINSSAGYGWPA